MKISRKSLEYLAETRGFAGDFLECILFAHDDDMVEVDTNHPAYPRAKPGLGDMVKSGLSAIGITEERVSAAIGRPCGCSERAEKLNELGRKIGIG
jgi:hypothetical protein